MPRRTLTLVDTTLRDGGYVNKHAFTIPECMDLIGCLSRAAVDIVEVGYFRRNDLFDGIGLTAHCPPEYLRTLPPLSGARYVVMIRPKEVSARHLEELTAYEIGGLRIPVTIRNLAQGLDLAAAAKDLGLHVCVNIIRCSELTIADFRMLEDRLAQVDLDVLYAADSNGAMMPGDVSRVVQYLRGITDKPVGCHTHDNLRLSVANALAAIQAGATWVDSTLTGVGKGAGNASTEIMLLLLEKLEGREITLDPLIEAVTTSSNPLFAEARIELFEQAVFGHRNFNVEDIDRWRASHQLIA